MIQSGTSISKLKSVQAYIQSVADAFAPVLDFEVAIVDEFLEVIAGTGKYKDQVGIVYGSGSISYQLLCTQHSFLVSDPQNCQMCQNCNIRPTCKVLAGLLYPIKLAGKTIGSISLYAFNEVQKENLLKDFPKLEEFLAQVVVLIAGKLNEIELHTKMTKMAEQFNTIINSVRQGIVTIDYSGKITHINQNAQELFMVPASQLMGRHIEEVFSGFSLGRLENMAEPYIEQNVFYKKKEQICHFMITVTEVKSETEWFSGYVITFRTISDMRKTVGRVIREDRKYSLDGILGTSQPIIELKKRMAMVAVTDSTILITGESGTGKELFARAIHQESLRKDAPFIAVNCGAIPEHLLESELFGYEEGAFTGARRSGKPGKFELANGGTLFLDEIGDMPLHLQVKMLRVLQDFTIERVGGVKPVLIDVRIIAATNRNLEAMIRDKEFRSDLFYRLSVIPFHILPLCERKEDIRLLIHYFVEKYNLILDKQIKGYTSDALTKMLAYPWPGNVRELENAVEYSANICPDQLVDDHHLPTRIIEHVKMITPASPKQCIQSIADLEKNALIEALHAFGAGSRGKEKAARSLGMSRSTLYRKIKELGLEDYA